MNQPLPESIQNLVAKWGHEATITITISTKSACSEWVEQKNETVKIMDEDAVNIPHPAYASISVALTKNLGNYESLKVSAMATLPCLPERINEKMLQASEIASAEVTRIVKDWIG